MAIFYERNVYVAVSRSTQKKYINFCNTEYKLNQGYIYKITNLSTNKIYIGSTKTSIEQRFQEHLTAKDTSSLHKDIQELGPDFYLLNWLKR